MRIGIAKLACAAAAVSLLAGGTIARSAEADVLPPVTERFQSETVEEIPSFQRHVSPLFGRLGCNGRSCHGSFQGRGDFRLSLFGYDFKADHDELLKGDPLRANAEKPLESLILVKPTDADMHEGGQRYKKGGWEYHVFRRWLEGGAKFDEKTDAQKLVALDIQPAEILFQAPGEQVQLTAVAVWPDGTREDVTALCRFQSNSDQVATITTDGLMTATEPGDTHVVVSYDNAVIAVPVIRPVSDQVGDKYPQVATPTKIDELVVQKLRKLGVVPSDLSTDAEFLRRVSLDLIGTLPTVGEVEQFLADASPSKRADKIEQLMMTPAYAAWWTTKLCDYTGNNDQKLNANQLGGARGGPTQQWYDWIHERVAGNVPYDEIVEGIVLSSSRLPGQSYTEYCESMSKLYHDDSEAKYADRPTMAYYWGRTGFRTTEERAIGFAYTFMGIRIQCAQCHKHPFDQWAKADFDAFEPFFSRTQTFAQGTREKEVREEYEQIVKDLGLDDSELKGNQLRNKFAEKMREGKTVPFPEISVTKPNAQPARGGKNRKKQEPKPVLAKVLGGEPIDLNQVADARQPLMDWLRAKDNPYFAKAFVNRVWANYFSVGIVQPPDDLSLANPPSNRALLDYLAQGFIEHDFDMKWLHREICNSRTYQLSWQPNETNAKDERNFARSVPRRLAAEVAVDAIALAVASDEKAATMAVNMEGRALSVPGSSARTANGNNGFALQVFGRSIRESNCDCDRSMDASLLQTVYLQNDSSVLQAIGGNKDTWISQISTKGSGRLTDGSPTERIDVARETTRMKARLAKAKKEGNDGQVKRLQARLKELNELADTKQRSTTSEVTLDDVSLIRQAYLRTVSRHPTPEEIDRCTLFLAASPNPAEGARGLLWTLINTKEFIVNH
ncbi:MAG: DUF1549 and DUF1553 domain-containing protein [Pirellulaceae bacterium]